RWPVQCLDFYSVPRKVWPMAPLAPGMGELVFLNIMLSNLCNRIWSSSRDFVACLKSVEKEVRAVMESGNDFSVVGLPEISDNLERILKFIQQPQVNLDVWRILDAVM